jgi:hypothetical protein
MISSGGSFELLRGLDTFNTEAWLRRFFVVGLRGFDTFNSFAVETDESSSVYFRC